MTSADVPRPSATWLDRANVHVVRWRLAQDRDRAGAEPTARGGRIPRAFSLIDTRRLAGVAAETWSADGTDWVATRLVAPCPSGGSLVLLHGWLATPAHLVYLAWRMKPLLRAGIEVWFPRLPAHMERTPPGAVSGSRCLTADVDASAQLVRTAAAETNALGEWLAGRGTSPALWGISLGGWVAGVAVTHSECWRALVLWSAVVDPIDALQHSPLAAAVGVRADAASPSELSARLDDVVPSISYPADPRSSILMVTGRWDNVARFSAAEALARRWSAQLQVLPHGHISMMLSQRAWRAARNFVATTLSGSTSNADSID